MVGVDAVGEEERERADRRADHHCRERAEKHDCERVPDPPEMGVEPDPLEEGDADDRREGVAGGDQYGRADIRTDREVDHERGHRDRGPDAVTARQQRDHRDTRGRPQRRDVVVDEREP